MVKLRLKRMGSKFNAFYRIVAADARAPRDGKFIEEIGTYNPHTKEVRIKEELKNKWLNEGAVPSNTVKNLFTKIEAAKKAGNVNENVITLIKKAKKSKKQEAVITEETNEKNAEVKAENKETE
ncbi:MAG: 30S ribosomal protein S16 [Mycoplasmatales bacterium]|nr:30S ribosomal protein S16 [Mycoplasmatales bacterium]